VISTYVASDAVGAGGSKWLGSPSDVALVRGLTRIAQPITGSAGDYDRLLRAIGSARMVLLGEDTHGTHEHYVERARITQRLIAEQGFDAVVIEADWPPAAVVSMAIESVGSEYRLDEALRTFDRFPLWMWRNAEFVELLRWIHAFNMSRPVVPPVQLRGIDLYELATGISSVVDYLDAIDARAATRARERYRCFSPAGMDPQNYGAILSSPAGGDCSDVVQEQLTELATMSATGAPNPQGVVDADPAYFHALQSARAVRNAEAYFRALYLKPESSWNIRDAHMASSIDFLLAHLDLVRGNRSRVVIWAHNAHIGDARGTARSESGTWTLGQLLRERYPDDVFVVGFTTSVGTVHAATEWGEPGRTKALRRPIAGSHAALLGALRIPRFYCVFDDSESVSNALRAPRPQRGIGVRYLPELERDGHYYDARLSAQFDAVVHIERTRALQPRINR
jgi:erythromycin esterase-like protein